MAQKQLPTQTDFLEFQNQMTQLGFRKREHKTLRDAVIRLGLVNPRNHPGREASFEYHAFELKVVVHTTFVEELQKARDQDLGWVLIVKGDTVLYFAHPNRRTKHFFRNLYRNAKACKERIDNRPLCPECKRAMEIVNGKGLGARYWRCKSPFHKSKSLITTDWDHGLSIESLLFVETTRAVRARYNKMRKAQGKPYGTARIIRKRWKIQNPQNKIF